MAALVEDVRWRTSAKGRRYMVASLSDPSGQFEATVFDDVVAEQVANAAKAGACLLLNVELDRRPGDETPRVTIRTLQSFDNLARRTRLQLEVEVEDAETVHRLAGALAGDRGGTAQLRLRLRDAAADVDLVLGRDFVVDAELTARISRIEGVTAARLSVVEAPRLALVS
jgi:DNA polymerase-3 subunit alpha